MTTSPQDPLLNHQTNAVETFNILEAVRSLSLNALVAYSSPNKVYGDLEWIHTEEAETRFVMPEYPQGLNEKFLWTFQCLMDARKELRITMFAIGLGSMD